MTLSHIVWFNCDVTTSELTRSQRDLLAEISKIQRTNKQGWPGKPMSQLVGGDPNLNVLQALGLVEIVERESPHVAGRILRYVRAL